MEDDDRSVDEHDRRIAAINRRLRLAFVAGAEEQSQRGRGRPLTSTELGHILPAYPGDLAPSPSDSYAAGGSAKGSGGGAMRKTWDDRDYDVLFAGHPPTDAERPTRDEFEALAAQLGCSIGAARAQWNDARDLVLGSDSAASRLLKDYLRRRGWLG